MDERAIVLSASIVKAGRGVEDEKEQQRTERETIVDAVVKAQAGEISEDAREKILFALCGS